MSHRPSWWASVQLRYGPPAAAIGATPTPTAEIAAATNTARTNIYLTLALSPGAIPPQTRANSTQQRSKITNSDSRRQLALLAGRPGLLRPVAGLPRRAGASTPPRLRACRPHGAAWQLLAGGWRLRRVPVYSLRA